MAESENGKARFLEKVSSLRYELIELTRELVQVKSENPPGSERAVSELVAKHLKELGLHVEFIEPRSGRVNTVGILEGVGEGRALLFNGHYDTVPAGVLEHWTVDPFEGCIHNGWLIGRGAADEKGAIASLLIAIKALRACDIQLKGDLHVHAVADEEAGSRFGTRYLIEKGLTQADIAVVMEGSTFDRRICVRTAVRGLHWVEIIAKGRACHGSKPRSGINAVLKMAKILLTLDNYALKYTPHTLLPPPSIAAGTMIDGGIKENVIPAQCKAVCDIRVIPGMTEERILDELGNVIANLKKDDPELTAEVKTQFWWPSAEISAKEDIVEIARKATTRVVGYPLEPRGSSGSNDSTYLNRLARIPTIAFGPADQQLSRSHGANERVEIRNLINFAKIYGLMAMDACSVVES